MQRYVQNIVITSLVDKFSAAVKAADWPAACANVQACLEQIPQLSPVLSSMLGSAQGQALKASIKKEPVQRRAASAGAGKQPAPLEHQRGAESTGGKMHLTTSTKQQERLVPPAAPQSAGIYTFLLKDNKRIALVDIATGVVHRYPQQHGARVKPNGKHLSCTIYKPGKQEQLIFDELHAQGSLLALMLSLISCLLVYLKPEFCQLVCVCAFYDCAFDCAFVLVLLQTPPSSCWTWRPLATSSR